MELSWVELSEMKWREGRGNGEGMERVVGGMNFGRALVFVHFYHKKRGPLWDNDYNEKGGFFDNDYIRYWYVKLPHSCCSK